MKYILLTTILFASCLTEKKSVKHLALIQNKFPNLIAQNCADKFPIKETIEVRETIKLDTINNTDTLYRDSIINNELVKYIYLPSKVITKTIKKDSIIRVEDTRKLFIAQNKINEIQYELNQKTIKLRIAYIILLILGILTFASTILKRIL